MDDLLACIHLYQCDQRAREQVFCSTFALLQEWKFAHFKKLAVKVKLKFFAKYKIKHSKFV